LPKNNTELDTLTVWEVANPETASIAKPRTRRTEPVMNLSMEGDLLWEVPAKATGWRRIGAKMPGGNAGC